MEIMWLVVILKILELDALDLSGQVWPLYQRSDELFCASGLSVFMILDLLEETISNSFDLRNIRCKTGWVTV